MRKETFNPTTTNLTEYVANNHRELIGKLFEDTKTLELFFNNPNSLVDAQLGDNAIVFMDVGSTLQLNGCTRNPIGNTDIFNKIMKVLNLTDQETLCPHDLEGYVANFNLRKGAATMKGFTEQFVTYYLEQKLKAIAEEMEILAWRGDTASVDPELDLLDGYLKLLRQDPNVIDLDSTNPDIILRIQENYLKMPSKVTAKDDFRVFLGTRDYRNYQIALANKNLYNPSAPDTLYGTTAKIVEVPVLTNSVGNDEMVMGRISDFAIGTELLSEKDYINFFYGEESKKWFADYEFSFGVQIGRGEYLGVSNKSATLPVISAQPTNQTASVGGTATFSVTATGASSYQWQLDSGSGFANISGATSASYTTGTLASGDNGNKYRVIVTNVAGSVTSNEATLTVS